jgi:zinc protease
MTRILRPALVALTVLTLSACAAVQAHLPKLPHPSNSGAAGKPAATASAPAATPRRDEWPQAKSDVAADPRVRFGVLPNGMRYAIMQNATPPGQASLRLRIDAGSMNETDAQQGLAHFLEHMAFNGSKAIPEGEMVKILERHGLAFGADTNASTDFDETVYKLDLPQTDDDTVDSSLQILRETASELLIAQDAVDRERGIVLSEERTRDGPGYRIYKSRLAFLLKGQLPPTRFPIGQVDVLKTAPASQIRDFYAKYYRPDRAVLVAVGDFDVDAMEAKIKARFSDWKASAPDGGDPALGALAQRGPETLVKIEPGSSTFLQLSWTAAPDLAADSADKRRRQWLERLGFAVLNRRLGTIARGDKPPFLSAGAFRADQLHAAQITNVAVAARPGEWQAALQAVDQEQRRAVQFGVRQDELDREISEIRAALQAQLAGAATQKTPNLAGDMLDSLTDDDVITSPDQDLALFEKIVKDLKADTVSTALKAAFEGNGPLLYMASPTEVPGGDKAVADAYAASRAAPVTAQAAPTLTAWPYASFGAPGKVVDQHDVTDLDTVFVRFDNGVSLTVKPTKFRDDQVLVKVRIGDGMLDISRDRQSLIWASSALVEGGLGKISAEDMDRVLASRIYGASFRVEDDAFSLSGSTRRDDLDAQMQVLAGYVSDPGWRPEAFQRMKSYVATLNDQYVATDGGVFGRDLPGLIHAGDRRFTFPSPADIAGSDLAGFKGQFAPPLASGPIEVLVVGDITVDEAIEAVAATFGALPARSPAPPSSTDARTVGFPAASPDPVVLTHKGREDQAIAFLAWKTNDFFSDVQTARTLTLLGDVLDLRLTDEIREKQGVTYSPQVGSESSLVFKGWGYLSAQIEAPPANIDGFYRDVSKIAADLRDKPIGADELERARKPKLEGLEKARSTNEYWLYFLSGAQSDPRRLDAIRSVQASYQRITPAELQAAARKYLTDERAWKVVVRPGVK